MEQYKPKALLNTLFNRLKNHYHNLFVQSSEFYSFQIANKLGVSLHLALLMNDDCPTPYRPTPVTHTRRTAHFLGDKNESSSSLCVHEVCRDMKIASELMLVNDCGCQACL